MPGSWPRNELPYLTDKSCTITSRASKKYNCIAWAAGEDNRWWWPDPMEIGYWPSGVPRNETLESFFAAYATRGYKICSDESLETGLEKVALFGKKKRDGSIVPTHAARQLETGEWTSKLGPFEDVSHKTLDAVNGPVYGKMICCMSRPRPSPQRVLDSSTPGR